MKTIILDKNVNTVNLADLKTELRYQFIGLEIFNFYGDGDISKYIAIPQYDGTVVLSRGGGNYCGKAPNIEQLINNVAGELVKGSQYKFFLFESLEELAKWILKK